MPTTRRSVSITGVTYERLKLYAEQTGDTCSSLVEAIIATKLDELGVRTFTTEEAEALRPKNQGKPPLARPEKRAARKAKEPERSEPIRGGGVHFF